MAPEMGLELLELGKEGEGARWTSEPQTWDLETYGHGRAESGPALWGPLPRLWPGSSHCVCGAAVRVRWAEQCGDHAQPVQRAAPGMGCKLSCEDSP